MKDKSKGSTPPTRVWTPGGGVRPQPSSTTRYRPTPSRPGEVRPSIARPAARVQPKPRRAPKKPRLTLQERRAKREGFGRLYMDKQLREKTPMVFVTYEGPVRGTIHKRLVYDLDINTGEEKVRINKLSIKYCYKAADEEAVLKYLAVDEALRAQNLQPVKPRKERFQIDTRHLAMARQKKLPLKIVLRGGEIFTGPIDWYSHYEIKLSLGNEEGAVVVFRHAAYDYEVIGAPRETQRRSPRRPHPKTAYSARR